MARDAKKLTIFRLRRRRLALVTRRWQSSRRRRLKLSNIASRCAPALVLDTADRSQSNAVVVAAAAGLGRHDAGVGVPPDDVENRVAVEPTDGDRRHIVVPAAAVTD